MKILYKALSLQIFSSLVALGFILYSSSSISVPEGASVTTSGKSNSGVLGGNHHSVGVVSTADAMTANNNAVAEANTEASMSCESANFAAIEATQGMNMNAFAVVQSTMDSAKQATKEAGDSQKTALYGVAGIQTAVSAYALAKYAECSEAIAECEKVCEAEVAKNTHPVASEAKIAAKKNLTECMGLNSRCNESALQALMSAIQAALAALEAGKLCEGEDCKEKPPSSPDPNVPLIPPTPAVATVDSPDPGDTNSNSPVVHPFPNADNGGGGDGDSEKTADNSTGEEQGDAGTGGNTGSSNSSGSRGFAGIGSAGFGYGKDKENKKDEEEKDPENTSKKYAGNSSGSFLGGGSNSAYQRASAGRSGGSGSYAGNSKNKKYAANDKNSKDQNLKRKLFNSSGTHTTIFEKMSHIIRAYCSSDTEKCL